MSTVSHFNVSIFPMLMLLVLFFDNWKSQIQSGSVRHFSRFILVSFLSSLTLLLTWWVDGKVFPGAVALIWAVNLLYYFLVALTGFTWLTYVVEIIHADTNPHQKLMLVFKILLGLYLILLILTPELHLLMNVNEHNAFERGPLSFLPYLLNAFAMVSGMILALRQSLRETLPERKKSCLLLVYCPMFVIIASTVNLFFADLELIWPIMSLSILIYHFEIENQKITIDSLTGLNNRAQMDKHIAALFAQNKDSHWALILFDIDDFKSINDTYGHTEGDEALRRIADVLREAFSIPGSFIARSGGDEFAVILPAETYTDVERWINSFHQLLKQNNANNRVPFYLSVSAGYSLYDKNIDATPERLYQHADENMYQVKEAYKKEHRLERRNAGLRKTI